MTTDIGYTITEIGNWPREAYEIKPITSTGMLPPELGSLDYQAENRIIINPIFDLNAYNFNFYRPINANIGQNVVNDTYTIDFLNNTSSLIYVASGLRALQYDTNLTYFAINRSLPNNASYLGFLFYPKKLFLKPIAAVKQSSTEFTLTAKATLVSSVQMFFKDEAPKNNDLSAKYNYLYRSGKYFDATNDSIKNIDYNDYPTDLNNEVIFYYGLSSTQSIIRQKVLNFTQTNNPNTYVTLLEPNTQITKKIRWTSPFIEFTVAYQSFFQDPTTTVERFLPYLENLNNIYYDNPTTPSSDFNSGINYLYSPTTDKNALTFLMVQSSFNLTKRPQDIVNNVTKVNLNLQTTNFTYNTLTRVFNGNIVNVVSGVAGTNLNISYILDTDRIKYFENTQTVQSTLIPQNQINVAGSELSLTTLASGISSTQTNSNTVIYKTQYPPHYYSYNLSITKPNPSISQSILRETEVSNLSFYLTAHQYESRIGYSLAGNLTGATRLNTYLYSDFNTYNLDLPTFAYNANGLTDKIKYAVEYTEQALVNNVSAFIIRPSTQVPYDLITSPWVNAHESNILEITFPSEYAGTPKISIRPSLSTLVGINDALFCTNVSLTGLYQAPEYPLYMEVIKEEEDYIDITAELMNNPVSAFPGINLSNTTFKWFVNPNTDPNIKVNYLLKGNDNVYRPINTIQTGTSIPFNSNTWAIRVSGYGPQEVEITFYSDTLSSRISLSSNPLLFNYFTNQQIILDPILPLNNLEKIRTIALSASVPYKGRRYPLPGSFLEPFSVYWNWSYDNTFNNLTTPITAKYFYGNTISNDYSYSEINTTNVLSSMYFYINPEERSTPITKNARFNIFTVDTTPQVSASYQVNVDDFPSKNIFNADFSLAYQSFPNVSILNTRNNTFILARPDNDSGLLRATANTDVIPTLNAQGNQWTVVKDGVPAITNNSTTLDFNISGSSVIEVKFKVLNAAPAGWPYIHNIEQSIKIYRVPAAEFNKALDFNIYSEFAWPNSRNLIFLDNTNFDTQSVAPTAYGYKTSQTEIYNVSAVPSFKIYKYAYGNQRTAINDLATNTGQLTLPYNTEFFSPTGVTVTLTAYNDIYPENTPLRFQMVDGGNLVTRTYNITAQTIPYNAGIATNLRFKQNPKLIDYNTVFYTFTATATSFDTDVDRLIYVNQNIYTNPDKAPALPTSNTSTIVYILSTDNWTVKRSVPAIDGQFLLFTLRVGDSLNELTIDPSKINTLYLNASSDLNIKIPPSTFDNYSFSSYQGIRDLWDAKNVKTAQDPTKVQTLVAYSTSTNPEIYFNTYYTITASPIFLEFFTPTFENNPIVSYAVDFGENITKTGNIDNTFFYQYSSTGTFFVKYSAFYQDGSTEKIISNVPIIVKNFWNIYNQENIRIISEQILSLPYTLDEILIQPNEFGDKDIFNTSITRLNECLEYIKGNMQTMNIDAPIYYIGWLGNNNENKSQGIRWYTNSYGLNYYNQPTFASSEGNEYFTNIRDIHFGKNYIFVLDDKIFRLFKKDKNATEIIFKNKSEMEGMFFDPRSIAISEDETSLYLVDSIRHKIYRYDFDFSNENNIIFSLVLTIGSFGSLNDSNKFDFPSELQYYAENLYVLDFNNNCIKQYTRDLSWLHTYYDDVFKNDQLLNFTIHQTGLIYVISKSFKLYIFDTFGEKVIQTIQLNQFSTTDEIVKITFDENGEFLYIVTKRTIFKYSAAGEFVTTLIMPDIAGFDYTSAKFSEYRSLNFSTAKSILRVQDFVETFKIGSGLDTNYWSLDQMHLVSEQFAQDLNYNSSLIKMAQNLKTLRDTINGTFALVTEQTSRGTVSYFSLLPIDKKDRPVFDNDVENEKLFIGTNEFHIPSVINRELKKLYVSLETLKTSLDVISTNTSDIDLNGNQPDANICGGEFCWSWKAMSCYNLSLPIIRICNINPITYAELVNTFPVEYAPTKKWGDANSLCCGDVASPLE